MAKVKNISLGEKAQVRLEALVEKAHASSASEVVRDALRFYEFVLTETKSGTEFFEKKKGGELTKIRFFHW